MAGREVEHNRVTDALFACDLRDGRSGCPDRTKTSQLGSSLRPSNWSRNSLARVSGPAALAVKHLAKLTALQLTQRWSDRENGRVPTSVLGGAEAAISHDDDARLKASVA